ncbi:hypothetical protein [Fluviicola taffensis]|uniref:hypothetical protein n=1 Tax=Fluviicola taffensis TaxID=191579 RepID=UPI003137D4EB
MKNYRPVAAILFTTLLLSCGNNQEEKQEAETPVETQTLNEEPLPELKKEAKKPKEDTHVKITHTEDKLIDLVWQLPEVKSLSDKIERESKGKRHLVGRISSTPSDDQEYYGVSVAEDNGEALATYFEFRIYPDNTMYYYDVVEDQELTLKEWRTRKK